MGTNSGLRGRRRQALAAAAVALGTLVIVSACTSHSSSGAASGSTPLRMAPAVAPEAGTAGTANQASAGSALSTTGTHATTGSNASTSTASDTGALQPALIVIASISVQEPRAQNVAGAAARADTLAVAAGGRVDADDRDDGRDPTAQLTLRVPNAAVSTVLNQLGALGHETGRSRNTQDVTTQLADVDSRVLSARSAIRTLDALYARATQVRDVIAVETTLSQREADLESLESQQRTLRGQTALATITADFSVAPRRAVPPARTAAGPGGFLGGLEHGWDAFVTTVTALATALGAVLPFALVLLVAGAGYLLWRRRARRTAPADAS